MSRATPLDQEFDNSEINATDFSPLTPSEQATAEVSRKQGSSFVSRVLSRAGFARAGSALRASSSSAAPGQRHAWGKQNDLVVPSVQLRDTLNDHDGALLDPCSGSDEGGSRPVRLDHAPSHAARQATALSEELCSAEEAVAGVSATVDTVELEHGADDFFGREDMLYSTMPEMQSETGAMSDSSVDGGSAKGDVASNDDGEPILPPPQMWPTRFPKVVNGHHKMSDPKIDVEFLVSCEQSSPVMMKRGLQRYGFQPAQWRPSPEYTSPAMERCERLIEAWRHEMEWALPDETRHNIIA